MLGLSPLQFLRAILAGFFATFVMTVAGYWQRGLGLPRVDAADVLAQNADRSKLWGSYAHYVIGMILALGYARWFKPLLRGPDALKGLSYGLGTTLLADGLIMPLIDPRVGPFFVKTPRPSLLRAASLMVHLAYGLTLGLFYADCTGHRSKPKDFDLRVFVLERPTKRDVNSDRSFGGVCDKEDFGAARRVRTGRGRIALRG